MKTKYLKYMACFALALPQLAVLPVHAEEALSPLVVTAGRIAEDPARVSSDTTVITREEIVQSQATSVADILRVQTGIDVSSSGGSGKTTSVFIRGGESRHTLVLIDGVRVGAATTGSFDWANLSTADIERIEIVRGAQSSLYGADAMGGVIQIFTRKGEKGTQVRVHTEAGSYGTSSGSMSVTGKTESDVSYALTANGLRTGSVSAAANGVETDPYRQTTLSGRIALPVGDGELELIARSVDGKTSLDGGFPFGDVLNYTSNTKQTVSSVKLTYPISDMLESSLQLSRSGDESLTFNTDSDFTTRIDQITWQNHVDLDALSLLFGVDMHKDSGVSRSSKLDKSITQTAGFASLAWSADMVGINASVRYDKNSVSQNKTTYKFGAALHPLAGLKITANYGTGFKAPSINDLYYPGSGNLNLKPETSKGWDVGLGYEWEKKDLKTGLNATWFKQDFNNLIAWAPISPGSFTWLPSNVNEARTQGLELSGNLSYGPAYMRVNWTYLDAKDSKTGDLLPRRAKESGYAALGAAWFGLNLEVAEQVVGPRFSSAGNTKPMQGYNKTDVRLNYAVNKQWELTARVDNLEGKKYEEISGYGVLGRAWYAGVSAVF
ncbi:MAG: TonB-dependent receptor [Mariprofundaceae bacterium]|nr:TonB-dependent receptor [Mariprofundaceae bacterium]